jgi:hypothetical protein
MNICWSILIFWFWGGLCAVLGMFVNSLLAANHERRTNMSENSQKFWLCVFFMIIGIFIGATISGCDPDDPPVARRHSGVIDGGPIDTAEHGTQGYNPQNDYSFTDGGSAGHPRFAYWGCSRDFAGDFMEVGGMKIDTSIRGLWYDILEDKKVYVETARAIYTQENGYAMGWANGDSTETASLPGYGAGFDYKMSMPRAGSICIVSLFARTGENTGYVVWSPETGEKGEYWSSVQGPGARKPRSEIEIAAGNRQAMTTQNIPLASSDVDFLASTLTQTDEPVLCQNVVWQRPKFADGQYQMNNVGEFVILNHNDNEAIAQFTTPYTCSYQFVTPESLVMVNRTINAKLLIGDSEPNFIEPIEICVIADSNDFYRHIARSDYIAVCEPNGFSPYRVQADCGSILVVPLDEGQTLKIRIEDYSQLIDLIAPHWLQSYLPLDINKDGIVNLKDWL